MITPSYSATATERVLPRMALDFTTGVLDSRVTITRALNTATRVNSSGFVEAVNANLPRFDYDAATLAPKGLLIEETRANLALNSNLSASWPATRSSLISSGVVSPDGVNNALKLQEDGSNNSHFCNQNVTVASGATYTFSIFAKKGERDYLSIFCINTNAAANSFFNLANGTIVSVSAGATATIQNFGNGWYRCSVTTTTTSTTTGLYAGISANGVSSNYQGDGTSGIYPWGGQIEAGAFATSYIPTTTTSLTRNADDVTMTGTNFTSWYNQSEGAFQIEASTAIPSSGAQTFISISDNTPNNYILPYMLNALGYIYYKIVTLGASQCEFAAAISVTNNSIFKYAFCYKLNSAQIAVNTVLGAGDTSVNVPTVTLVEIGSRAGSSRMNGHMRKISYWPQRLLNQELQAFSK